MIKYLIPKKNNYSIILLISLFFCILFSQILFGENWWHVYFTSPGKRTNASYIAETPEKAIIRNIKNSKKSFYGAFYDITSKPIIDELVYAHRKGIDIKLVLEKDNYNKKEIKELVNAGIEIVTDNRKGLMHNKFAVIDGSVVWTGSFNLTYNDEYKNNNNVIEIHSSDIANIYLNEFNEMFARKIFGNKKEYGIFPSFKKKYYVKIDETDINVYFSPDNNIERIILERLKKAKQSVYFMAFSFTSDKLADTMITLKKNGIKVSGIIEKIGSNTKDSEYIKLRIEGINVRLDKNKYRMHHKVIIIDEKILITGSYNFSKNANEKNDENIIILNNNEITKLYIEEFFKLF
jgi:phosphatidylserine/phosphatidylglycerophosphate/cardiolipin synthase-like enzyme